MAAFLNSSALVLQPWSGFLACSHRSDCYLNDTSQSTFLPLCAFLSEGPIRRQKYCICDLSLGGEFCSIVTGAAEKRIVCFALCIAISIWPLLLGMWEIKQRMRVNQKRNTVYVSLWIATVSTFYLFAIGVIGIYTIAEGLGQPGNMYVRMSVLSLLPLCIVTSLCSAMVVSLELLKITNDPSIGGNWNRTKAKRARFFVVATCAILVVGAFSLVYFININMAFGFIFLCVASGAVFSFRSGRQFNNIARVFAARTKSMRTTLRFRSAIAANRQTSLGLCGTVLSTLSMAIVTTTIPMPINENAFPASSGVLVVLGVFLCVTSHASINFGRHVRLSHGPRSTAITRIPGYGGLFATSVQSSMTPLSPGFHK